MEDVYFVTGYPGFIASELVRQLLQDHQQRIKHMYLLVLPHLKEKAQRQMNGLLQQGASNDLRFTIITGDITHPNLSMDKTVCDTLQNRVTHVFHLAAIYDLAVSEQIAYQVNVIGTNHMNNWVKQLTKLKRYIYFSTAYVSGKREGRIYEHELRTNQTFKNHYEKTKYEAEISVDNFKSDIPITIIRPGIVIGHSGTGETSKFDGLYFLLNYLDRLRFMPNLPYFGDGVAEGNFVPIDYVLEATSYLSIHPIGTGKTYHLTDPAPYRMHDIQTLLSEAYIGKQPKGRIPVSIVRFALTAPFIRKWLRVEREALDYFLTQSSYSTAQASNDLKGTNITCPGFNHTAQAIIHYYRKYKDDYTKQIRIT